MRISNIKNNKDFPYIPIISSIFDSTYDFSDLGNKKDPLDELIFILLTVKTDHKIYGSLWESFKFRFPAWEDVLVTSIEEIASEISFGGLQKQKAMRIKNTLKKLKELTGKLDLNFLIYMDDRESEKFLMSLPGVGKKVARCVLMYSLGRNVFPIDSNIMRVCKRLGLIDFNCSNQGLYDKIQDIIPNELRYNLHVNMVRFGREICREGKPKCMICPITRFCYMEQSE